MRTYRGHREEDENVVIVSNDGLYPGELKPRGALLLHGLDPAAFDWGNSSAPTLNLALNILLDVTGERLLSIMACHDFKDTVISELGDGWELTELEVLKWLVGYLWSKYRDSN